MKAVIPAAGLGTRLLPATKSMPKEMLPVVDKPVIQYVVEEAARSGLKDILIVTGSGKRAIEDHFDHSIELEHHLQERGRGDALRLLEEIADLADIHYVRQKEPLGLGHAVLSARRFVGQEPFAVLLGDDLIHDATPCTKQLLEIHGETGAPVFSAMQVPRKEISRYGAVDGEPIPEHPGRHRVHAIVEKPSPEDAPSTLATMGRYVFTPSVFKELERTGPGHGGEIQLTDAMSALARRETMHAWEFSGRRLDVGSVDGFLEANLYMALRRKEFSKSTRSMAKRILDEAVDGREPGVGGAGHLP